MKSHLTSASRIIRWSKEIIKSRGIIAMLQRVNNQALFRLAIQVMPTFFKSELCLLPINHLGYKPLKPIILKLHHNLKALKWISKIILAYKSQEELVHTEVQVLKLSYKKSRVNRKVNLICMART